MARIPGGWCSVDGAFRTMAMENGELKKALVLLPDPEVGDDVGSSSLDDDAMDSTLWLVAMGWGNGEGSGLR